MILMRGVSNVHHHDGGLIPHGKDNVAGASGYRLTEGHISGRKSCCEPV